VEPPQNGTGARLRLHRGGAFRRRLAALFGRDEAAADEISRRLVHGAGAFVLVYYLLPGRLFVVVTTEQALLIALAAVGVLEVLRLGFGAELPTIRGYEARRPASYVFYAVGLVVAVVLFPEPVAAAVVLGTALVDPVAGELRRTGRGPAWTLGGPFLLYTGLAAGALGFVGHWGWGWSLTLGGLAAAVAVAVERWRFRWLDDDLTMTVVPAVVLYGAGVLALGLPR